VDSLLDKFHLISWLFFWKGSTFTLATLKLMVKLMIENQICLQLLIRSLTINLVTQPTQMFSTLHKEMILLQHVQRPISTFQLKDQTLLYTATEVHPSDPTKSQASLPQTTEPAPTP
jgi:hypothetical protein